jgi:hypothetical protein
MPDALLHAGALLAVLAGLGWLALAMEVHWAQAMGAAPRSPGTARRLRVQGALAQMAGLALCLAVDHPSLAVLVWTMALAGAALAIAFTLSWRPHWLRVLVRP